MSKTDLKSSDSAGERGEVQDLIDLKEIFFGILQHWKGIILSTFLTACIALSVSKFIMVPQYAATSTLYVFSKSTSITSMLDLQTGTSLTKDYIYVVKKSTILNRVIKDLGLKMTDKELREMVTIENPEDSRLLNITVENPDPELAKSIADELADVASDFIAEKMNQDPPNVINYSDAGDEPVSPAVAKNTVIGAAIGLLLAVFLAVIQTLIHDTIVNPDDVEKKLGITLIGTMPVESFRSRSQRRRRKTGR